MSIAPKLYITRMLLLGLLSVLLLAAMVTCDTEEFEAGPLGAVEVAPGDDIQIRLMLSLTELGDLGSPEYHGAVLAVEDYGPIKGHSVSVGAPLDSLCTGEGGSAAADTVTGDPRVVGAIGTSCSVAAVEALPIISEAGLVMVSPSNTALSLTSDLRGNAGSNHHPGYYRTSNNDLHQARAVAHFAYNELNLRSVATIDDGDPYTSGLTGAFKITFEALGGSVPAIATISRGDTNMIPALNRIAEGRPDGLFFPIFPREGIHVLRQLDQLAGLEDVALIGGAALLASELLALQESEGAYFPAPALDLGANVNEATGRSGEELIAAYKKRSEESSTHTYLAHGYDAATILLRAIEEVAVADGETLFIDRARLREALTGTTGFSGIIGTISCDVFGDCGTGRVRILHHTDSSVTDVSELPVVHRFAP